MATYAPFFHLPSMVHTSTTTYTSPANRHPTLQLHGQPQSVFGAAKSETVANGAILNGKRESISTRLNSTRPSHQNSSLFFRLPAELRNKIYVQLLCPEAPSRTDLAKPQKDLSVKGFNQTSTQTHLYPSILSTCQRIHAEATPLLYGTHIFHAHPSLLTSLPHLTTPTKPVLYTTVTDLIARWQISLRLDTDPRFTFEQATAAFSNAEYLEIRVWQAQFEACDYAVLKLFTGVRGVKAARVGGSVDPELARWLEHTMMQPSQEQRDGEMCLCDDGECPGFEGRREVVCGRCYRKAGVEWVERDWDLWRFGAR